MTTPNTAGGLPEPTARRLPAPRRPHRDPRQHPAAKGQRLPRVQFLDSAVMQNKSSNRAATQAVDAANASRKVRRRLVRAKALLRESESQLHNLPEQYRPAELIERVRLFLHRDDAEPNPKERP